MSDPGGVAERLRAARKAAGLTQEEAAERAGVHKVSVSRWEGGRTIGTDDLARLARAYHTTVGALLGEGSRSAALPPAAVTESELYDDPRYWRGRQDELVNTMEHVSSAMRQATAMHDRALATQREIIANTTPVPHSQLDAGLTEQERAFLAIMRQGGEELRARLERQAREALETQTPPPDDQGRRASGE